MEKICFKCGECKPLSDFYKHKRMADGHVNKCKDCYKADVHKNRIDKIEYYREYDRVRGNRQGVEYTRNYRNEFPMKYAAHCLVSRAVNDGRIEKTRECQCCGIYSERIHGHHDDYAKPLIVRWLCPACHMAWHAENGEGANAS